MCYNSAGRIPAGGRLEIVDMTIERGTINPDDARLLRAEHEAGESVFALFSLKHEIARGAIVKRIKFAGGIIRGRSAANTLRMKREGPAGRSRLTKAAHDKVRGAKRKFGELVTRASRKSRLVGHGEMEVFHALVDKKLPAETQRPVGKYNIDIAIGDDIAVEIATEGNTRWCRSGERFKYLRDQWYTIICVAFHHARSDALIGNLDDVIALIERTYRLPAINRKHWMVWCRSERFVRVRNNRGQLTAVSVPERFFNVIREIDAR